MNKKIIAIDESGNTRKIEVRYPRIPNITLSGRGPDILGLPSLYENGSKLNVSDVSKDKTKITIFDDFGDYEILKVSSDW